MHCGRNFCSLREDSKTSTNLFFLLYNFTINGLFLNIDLGNLRIRFFFFLLSRKLSPLYLKETLYDFSLTNFSRLPLMPCWGHYYVKQTYLYVRTLIPGQQIDNYHFHNCEGKREQVRESSPSYSEWHAI